MPSRAILVIGALGFTCLVLLALLILQLVGTEPDVRDEGAAPLPATSPAAPLDLSEEARASLRDAYDEPLLAEIAALLDAVHDHDAPLDRSLRPYLAALVERMNVEQEPYRARLLAPTLDTADRRAERLQASFREAGLSPDLLTLTGHTGPDGVVVERP